METVTGSIFLGSKITADGDYSHEIKRRLLLGRKTMTNLDNVLKNRDITLPTKVCLVKTMIFSNTYVWMWELDHKEGWVPKNWCFETVVLEKTLESPLDSKEIQPVYPEGNQPWIFIGRTDAEAEALILWPPDVKSRLTGKDPDAGETECMRRRGRQRMRWLDGIETQWTWVCSNSGRQWRRGKPAVLQSMGSQRVRHLSDWTRKDTGQRCPRVIFSRSCVQTHKRNILIFLKEHWAAYSFVARLDRISSSPSAI